MLLMSTRDLAMDRVSAPQSWLHVVGNDCFWHPCDLPTTLRVARPRFLAVTMPPWRGPFQSGPGGPIVRRVHPRFRRWVVTLPRRAGKKETTWTVQNIAEISRQNAFA